MIPAILKRKLFDIPNPNWVLWLGISFAFGVIFLFIPYEQDDGVHSDWNTVVSCFQYWIPQLMPGLRDGYFRDVVWGMFDDLKQPLIHFIPIPILIGFFAQYIIMLIRYMLRRLKPTAK